MGFLEADRYVALSEDAQTVSEGRIDGGVADGFLASESARTSPARLAVVTAATAALVSHISFDMKTVRPDGSSGLIKD